MQLKEVCVLANSCTSQALCLFQLVMHIINYPADDNIEKQGFDSAWQQICHDCEREALRSPLIIRQRYDTIVRSWEEAKNKLRVTFMQKKKKKTFSFWFLLLLLLFPGKDARLYVFRLRALRRGVEEKQLVRSKCDSRENKLEKTKGKAQEGICKFGKIIQATLSTCSCRSIGRGLGKLNGRSIVTTIKLPSFFSAGKC